MRSHHTAMRPEWWPRERGVREGARSQVMDLAGHVRTEDVHAAGEF